MGLSIYIIWDVVNSLCVGKGQGRESLNENSRKREVIRLFIFHIVSPRLQQTSMILIKPFY